MESGNLRQLPSLADRPDGETLGLPVGGRLGKSQSVRFRLNDIFCPAEYLLETDLRTPILYWGAKLPTDSATSNAEARKMAVKANESSTVWQKRQEAERLADPTWKDSVPISSVEPGEKE